MCGLVEEMAQGYSFGLCDDYRSLIIVLKVVEGKSLTAQNISVDNSADS